MKFLCPSCKAKYQIADDKVVGRTVKMKCRQCGHLIEINEAMGERPSLPAPAPAPSPGQVATPKEKPERAGATVTGEARPVASPIAPRVAPPKPATSRDVAPPSSKAPEVPRKAPEAPPRPGAAATRPGATGSMGRAAPVAPRPARPEGVAPVGKPSVLGPGSTRGSSIQGRQNAPQSPSPDAPAVTIAQEEGTEHRPMAVAGSTVLERAVSNRDKPLTIGTPRAPSKAQPSTESRAATSRGRDGVQEGPNRGAKVDPLAGAFAKAVEQPPASTGEHPLAGDEWYVGVGEQPIGPIRLAELRDRAAKSEITLECLVWRDGLEDWRPLTAFPELVAVVEEGIASARSMIPPAAELSVSLPTVPRVIPQGAAEPAGPTVREELSPAAPLSDIHAAPAGVVASPLLVAATKPIERVGDEEALYPAGVPPKAKIPLAAWGAVVMALVLGVTIGTVLIKPEPPKQIIKYVPVQASAGVNAAAGVVPDAIASAQPGAENAVAVGASDDTRQASLSNGRKPAGPTVGQSSGEASGASSAAAPMALKGLSGLRGLGGPQGGPQSGGPVSGGGAQLDSATLTKTVSRYTPSVKRGCWQPALDMRAPDAPTTARVTATITVGASGKVQNVSTSGDPKGYHGLASCIQMRVKNWEFPPSGGTTEFNVPFVFAAQ